MQLSYGGEYQTPEDGARLARILFLDAVRKHYPEVLERLRGLLPQLHNPELDILLREWASAHNLPDWVLLTAKCTLYVWERGASQACLCYAGECYSYPGPIGQEERGFRFYAAWDPLNETWKQFEERAAKDFMVGLAEYRRRMDALVRKRGYERPPEKRNTEAFDWLALRVVRGMTCEAIADMENTGGGYPDANVISKATADLACLVGVTLPTKPGRPRKNP